MQQNRAIFALLTLLCMALTYPMKNKANPMKILCITHADFETPGIIEDWAKNNKHQFTLCKPYQDESCPANSAFDFLVIMGGPQSARDWKKTSYLRDEVALIKKAIKQNQVVVGFCLGAQLIGEAMGSETEPSPEKEVGVFRVTLNDEAESDPIFSGFPKEFLAIHWHNDMPGLTRATTLLASSLGCPRQIVRYAARVYGLQCHFEITKQGIETMIKACPADFAKSRYTQTPEEFLAQNYTEINNHMLTILDRLAQLHNK